MDRPTQFTNKISHEILERLGIGEPIEWILDDDYMPTASTVREWRLANDDWDKAYEAAFKDGLMRMALETLTIADEVQYGEEITEQQTKSGKVLSRSVKRVDMLAHRKLRIETRWKLLEKLDPERFGTKSKVEGNLTFTDPVTIYKIPDNGRD